MIIKLFKEINPWHNIKILHTNMRADILAGITVAIIALPMALAFGKLSGLGPIAGVWGAIAGGIVGGLFGGCMVGVSGPTAPKAAQIAAFMGVIVGSSDNPQVAAFSIIFLSGLILIGISMLRISRFIHYIPYSVLSGFMCGIGAMVIIIQINPFIGLDAEKNIFLVFKNFGQNIKNINVEALYVSIPCLLILFLWSSVEKRIKFLKNIPAPLVVLVIGTSIAHLSGPDKFNIYYIGQEMIQETTKDSNHFNLYIPNLNDFFKFIGPAFALAGLAVLDSLLSCKVADNLTGTRHSSDRETFGQGMANIAAGLIGGVTTATATMRTVANIKFGAKTPLASIVHGFTLLAIILGLGFLVSAIPTACLAAILFKVGIDILDYRIIPVLRKLPKIDLLVFIIVLFVTVFADLMIAVFIGIIFSCIGSIKELKITLKSNLHSILPISESDFISKEENEKFEKLQVNILELRGPLFFGSIEPLINIYNMAVKHKILIINMSHITKIDISGIYGLEDLINGAKANGIEVKILNSNSDIKKVLEKVNFIKNIGESNYKNSKNSIISELNSFIL